MASSENHPFYPKNMKLPGYIPNKRGTVEILGFLSVIAVVVLSAAWFISGRRKKPFSVSRRLALCWFLYCAYWHTLLEGYWALYHRVITSDTSLLGELWKEYAMGDSRFVISDTFIVCLESVTSSVIGPLCFITFMTFIMNSNYRYICQIILSTCQLYGYSFYYLTELTDDFIHCPKFHPLYFWFYFFSINFMWILVPLALIFDSVKHLVSCQIASDESNRRGNKKGI